ncbi:hypothetical protein Tco_0331184 [Tanacetum coccineum]
MLCLAHQLSHDMGLLAELTASLKMLYFVVHLQLLQEQNMPLWAMQFALLIHIKSHFLKKTFHKSYILLYCQTCLIVKSIDCYRLQSGYTLTIGLGKVEELYGSQRFAANWNVVMLVVDRLIGVMLRGLSSNGCNQLSAIFPSSGLGGQIEDLFLNFYGGWVCLSWNIQSGYVKS